jgi:tetratricopeptide (TPR) repeat protein
VVKDTFIGIVQGGSESIVSIGVLDARDKQLAARSFRLERAHFPGYFTTHANQAPRLVDLVDMRPIAAFLDAHVRDPRTVRVVVEIPDPFVTRLDNSGYATGALLVIDSVYLKVLALLYTKGYMHWTYQLAEEKGIVAAYPLPNTPEYAHIWPHQPRYLGQGMASAYADVLLGSCPSAEHAALTAAIMARNTGAYCYWASPGVVQSSQDIVTDIRQYVDSKYSCPSVYSGSETYTLIFRPLRSEDKQHVYGIAENLTEAAEADMIRLYGATKRDDIEKIPLKYAVAAKKYAYLGENDAIKAALLTVCKLWGITVHCHSTTYNEECWRHGIVYPLVAAETWMLAALQPDTAPFLTTPPASPAAIAHPKSRFYQRQANAHRAERQLEKALEAYQQSLSILRAGGDRANEGITLANIGSILIELDRHDEALRALHEALAILQAAGARSSEVSTLIMIGMVYLKQGQTDQALDASRQALASARTSGDQQVFVETLDNMAAVYGHLSRFDEALDVIQQALSTDPALHDRLVEASVLGKMGAAYLKRGEVQAAVAAHERELAIMQGLGVKPRAAAASWNLGLALGQQGNLARAVELMQVLVDFLRETANPRADEFAVQVAQMRQQLQNNAL